MQRYVKKNITTYKYMYRRNYTHIKNNVFTTKQSRPSTVYMKKIKIIQSINEKAHD